MSSATDLSAALSSASSAATQVVNELAAAQTTIVDLTRDLNAARTQIADLQAQIDAAGSPTPTPEPSPTPTPTTTLIGATIGGNDGGLNVIADIRRCYNQGGLPSTVDSSLKQASSRCRDGGVVWTSYKGSLVTDSMLRTSLRAISDHLRVKNQTGFVTYEHEPDIKGGVPIATYKAGYDQLERVIAEFTNLSPIVCLTGFSGDKDPSIWETYYRPNHTLIGFDHYNKGHQRIGEPMATPAESWGLLVKWAKSKGKKVAIGETGVGDDAVPGTVIKTREQWYSEYRKYALDPINGIVAVCAFDSGLAVLSNSEAKAWYAK